ncbi:uncharacterized protein LOC132561614 [Ylistrum balloti]|uniref:uncharacterized protein LOC132561614 n=1 Tax=Ylistrum balloti TaxID=509963 RepID=UPI002905C7E9|nr:uncharacterized protein LOC132561614 [Ylistrum balloti]
MYYQQTTYKRDYDRSPRGRPSYRDSSPHGGYYQEGPPRGDERYFREAPREPIDRRYGDNSPRQPMQPGEASYADPHRSPHHSPRSPRRQPPLSDRRGYDGASPVPGLSNPRQYPYYDMSREDLPPFNTYAINSTTQHDYGDFDSRTTQREYGDFTQRQQMINDIRARGDAELARRYESKYDSRPYFNEKDPPSFYRDLPLTDRSGYDVDRRATTFDDAPLTDRSDRNRRHRSPSPSPRPPPPANAFEDMSKGQMRKELDRIELHDGNFKPYSHHNLGGGAERPRQLYLPYHLQNIQQRHDNPRPCAHHQRLYEQHIQADPRPSPGASSGSKDHQAYSGPIAHHKRLYERPPSKRSNEGKVNKDVSEKQGPGVLSRPIEHHEHRFEDNLMKTTSPRRSQDPGVLTRPIENDEHRFENNLVETNHPRRSTNPGVLPRPIEHSEHRFENNLVETNFSGQNKDMEPEGPFYPDALLRPEERRVRQKLPMHDFHRFERVHKTDNPERIYADPKQDPAGTGAGVFLFIRTDDDGFHDVKRAFELCSGEMPERKLLGFATAKMIDVKEGGYDWKRQPMMAQWNKQYYNLEHNGPVTKMMVINWFKGEKQAREWVDRDREFKHASFPMPYGNQSSILSLKYRPSSGYRTFMMMEFNDISNRQELHKYIDFLCSKLQNYKADAAFIDTSPLAVKSSIFHPRSHIVCHLFCDMNEANLFFRDVVSGSKFQHANMTTLVFQLFDIMKR